MKEILNSPKLQGLENLNGQMAASMKDKLVMGRDKAKEFFIVLPKITLTMEAGKKEENKA